MMQGCAGRWRLPGYGAPANSGNFRTPPGPPTKALPVDPPRKTCGAVLRTRCSARWPRGWAAHGGRRGGGTACWHSRLSNSRLSLATKVVF
jgi:hypothetical protein